jgi:hypothetical protein
MEIKKSSRENGNLNCPHCHEALDKVEMDALSDWAGAILWVCFNESCEYYRKSWASLSKQGVLAGYRYYYDDDNHTAGPLLILNPDSYRDRVVNLEDEWRDTFMFFKYDNDYVFNDTVGLKEDIQKLENQVDRVERRLDQLLMLVQTLMEESRQKNR